VTGQPPAGIGGPRGGRFVTAAVTPEEVAAVDRGEADGWMERRLQETADGFHFHSDQDAPEAGPGGTPCIKIDLSVRISGEFVTPEVIASATRQLVDSMVARLRELAAEAEREGM
jgi:hypothetical protein